MTILVIVTIMLIFTAVLLIRAALFTNSNEKKYEEDEIVFDRQSAVNALSKLVKCRTISYYDHEKEDEAEFEKLIKLLPELYPKVFTHCIFNRLPDRALLFKWKGKEKGEAAVLMSHFDVVPVVEEKWTKPPFDALIENGVMWGRGTLDTKVTFNGILSAAENLIGQGFEPLNDIYFAFSGQEEINGRGAVNIVNYFRENDIKLWMVLDEGGAVVENVFPGISSACGLIGIAEKGLINLTYSADSDGGHASAPSSHTPVGVLSGACVNIENHPFKAHFTKPVLEMFDALGRHSTFAYKIIFANMWLFRPLLDFICRKKGGELNALVRTTVAFTQCEGSVAPNVVPAKAFFVSNIRINPEDSVDSAVEYIRRTVNNPDIKLEITQSMEPSPISRTDCRGWFTVKKAVSRTWKNALVAPYLMLQCSDSRHYAALSDKVYRFSAMELSADERRSIHGNDEHIRLENVERAVEFFMRVMKEC